MTGESSGGIEWPDSSSSSTGGADESSSTGEPVRVNPRSETTEDACVDVTVEVEPVIPTVMLVIDQSGSMTGSFQGVSRWDAVYETLMGPDGVVLSLEHRVNFGLALYTSYNGFEGGSGFPAGQCPVITGAEPALGNHAALDAIYSPAEPADETPTGDALVALTGPLAAIEGPKAFIVATDGEPDTCKQPNPQEGQQESLDAASAAFALGIETYVLSVGGDVSAMHLQELANAGVGLDPSDGLAPFYQALSPEQLVVAFDAIIADLISCEFDLEGVIQGEACEGDVYLNGQLLECGSDWDALDDSTIELLGEACLEVKSGSAATVEAEFPCGAVYVP